jgi:sugar lactone lactonase YvrE
LNVCEGDDRRITRMGADGKVESLVDNFKGGRFNRPNDVICHSNGCLYFTDPDKRRAYHEREIPGPEGDNGLWDSACVYRLAHDGSLTVLAHCEYPNGLALSPDERTMYVANTRSSQYIHAINLDATGNMVGGRFESISLHQRVACELDFLDRGCAPPRCMARPVMVGRIGCVSGTIRVLFRKAGCGAAADGRTLWALGRSISIGY